MSAAQGSPCYLYGFMRPPNTPIPALAGVFGGPVETHAHGDLAVVVSPAPATPQRAARDDLIAHSDVLQTLILDYDIVPAAFGTVYPAGFQLSELPRAERKSISRLLDDLAGKVEFQIRATYDETGVTSSLVESDSKLRRLRAARRQDYSTQLAIGTRFAEVLDRRRRQDSDAAAKRLSKVADRLVAESPAGDWGAYRLSVLVSRRKQDDFERMVSEMAGQQESYLSLDWLGPLPPYSFAQAPGVRRAG